MIAEPLRHLARPIGEFRLLDGNPRRGDVASVKRSLTRFGQRKPIVVREDGTVEAGNTTLKAALELGWTEIAVVAFGDDDVTAKAFAFPKKENLPFFFVSAADGTNVVAIFREAIALAWAHKKRGEKDFTQEVLDLIEEKNLGIDDKALRAFGRALYHPGSPGSPGSSSGGGFAAEER